jgi:hypothetical protein
VAADAAAIEAAPLSLSPAEVAAVETPQAAPEATLAADAHPSGAQVEGDQHSVTSYDAVHPATEIGEVEGPSVTGVENAPGGALVTPIESLTGEASDSQYTIGPTQLEVDDSVAVNFAGSQAPDLHSPLEVAPEPPPAPQVATGSHSDSQAAPEPTVAAAATAPLPAHLDIDAAVMEAAVKRVLERLEPHLHEILSNGVLRPLIENALQKELEKK